MQKIVFVWSANEAKKHYRQQRAWGEKTNKKTRKCIDVESVECVSFSPAFSPWEGSVASLTSSKPLPPPTLCVFLSACMCLCVGAKPLFKDPHKDLAAAI